MKRKSFANRAAKVVETTDPRADLRKDREHRPQGAQLERATRLN